MRLLKPVLLAVPAAVVVVLAVANRGPVELHARPDGLPLPEPMASWPDSVVMPVYAALLAATFVGVVIGVALERLRDSGRRREARRLGAEASRLRKENRALRARLGEDPEDGALRLAAPPA